MSKNELCLLYYRVSLCSDREEMQSNYNEKATTPIRPTTSANGSPQPAQSSPGAASQALVSQMQCGQRQQINEQLSFLWHIIGRKPFFSKASQQTSEHQITFFPLINSFTQTKFSDKRAKLTKLENKQINMESGSHSSPLIGVGVFFAA